MPRPGGERTRTHSPAVRSALADRLARLARDGRLRRCDPELAAEHFLYASRPTRCSCSPSRP
ncbi:TetR/AcrR family transcriptional regulator C-terminal domain-containing protein [Streptomyces sp. NPDC088551]|uniref:TetR/AcrR family transcriptional regulator C-terminal domain-containing protein n=1 Tax=Streptomyces sp. NPDC088551 TaxID=3365863 RepID=UPI00380EF348